MSTGWRRLLELPPDAREVLRSRAKAVARAAESTETTDVTEILELRSQGHAFALPLSVVDGVTDLVSVAAVPRSPPIVRGLVGFRGSVLVGVELSSLVRRAQGIADLQRLVAISANGRRVAILAEKVMSVRSVPLGTFQPDPVSRLPFVVGTDEHFLSLLDPGALVAYVVRELEHAGGGA